MHLLLATSLAGVRGTVTLAGVLTLPPVMADGTPFASHPAQVAWPIS
jgi:NhaP-type Na+/H+ or K+/H+ antiporter